MIADPLVWGRTEGDGFCVLLFGTGRRPVFRSAEKAGRRFGGDRGTVPLSEAEFGYDSRTSVERVIADPLLLVWGRTEGDGFCVSLFGTGRRPVFRSAAKAKV